MQNNKQIGFVSNRLSLPLFMVSRNKLKANHIGRVREYISKRAQHYSNDCVKENAADTKTLQHMRHLQGNDNIVNAPYPEKRPLKCSRSLTSTHEWQQAPNRYGVPRVPFQSRMGSKGTVFEKLHVHKSLVPRKKNVWRFYRLPGGIERFLNAENAHKGVFLSNARDHRATTRCMISNPLTCYHDPKEPGPTDTHTPYYEIYYNATQPVLTAPPNPHLFNRFSCVPTKQSVLVPRHISFAPGPGRYEVRYPNICPCMPKRIYMPGLQLIIDEQKRLKFRRLPFVKIHKNLYCSPDWRHVQGQGHRRLFKLSKNEKSLQLKKPQELKKSDKQIKLFADARYMYMITTPFRHPISLRDEPVPPYHPKIVYNCIAKRIKRKQLRNNKKIAFNSGQDRFKDADRPPQLTVKQLEEIKMRLPEERRMIDRPLVLRRKSQIPSRVAEVPDHMKATYIPKLRKRLFKFLPLPGAKVLVTESDIRPDITYNEQNPSGYYRKHFDERNYFRDSILNPVALVLPDPAARSEETILQEHSVEVLDHQKELEVSNK